MGLGGRDPIHPPLPASGYTHRLTLGLFPSGSSPTFTSNTTPTTHLPLPPPHFPRGLQQSPPRLCMVGKFEVAWLAGWLAGAREWGGGAGVGGMSFTDWPGVQHVKSLSWQFGSGEG